MARRNRTSDSPAISSKKSTAAERLRASLEADIRAAWELRGVDLAQALTISHQTLAAARSHQLPDISAYALRNLAELQYRRGDYEAAFEYASEAKEIFEMLKDISGLVTVLSTIGNVYLRKGDTEKSLEYHHLCLEYRRSLGDESGQAVTLNNIGNAYLSLGDPALALTHYRESLAIKQKLGDLSGQSVTLNNMGVVLQGLGEHASALDYFQQSLEVSRQVMDKITEGDATNNLANLYAQMENYPLALHYQTQSLKIRQDFGDRYGEANALNSIGNTYRLMGNTAAAADFYAQALALCQEIGIPKTEAAVLANLGHLNKITSNKALAQQYYEKALDLYRQTHEPFGEVESLISLGELLTDSDTAAAESLLQKAQQLAMQLDARNLEMQACRALAACYQAVGQFEKALNYYIRYHTIERSLFNEGTEIKFRRLQMMHELQTAQQQAEIYRQKNHEIQEAYEELTIINEQLRKLQIDISRQHNETVSMIQILKRVNQSLELDQVIQDIFQCLRGIFDFQIAVIQLLENQPDDSLVLYDILGEGIDETLRAKVRSIRVPLSSRETLTGSAVRNNKVYYISTVNPETLRHFDKLLYDEVKYVSVLCIPIALENQVLGCFTFLGTKMPFSLGMTEIERIERFVALVAASLHNARQFTELRSLKEQLRVQSDEIAIKNRNITDSIMYAGQIQRMILPKEADIKRYLPNSFFLFMPKDIIGGDFYWVASHNDRIIIAVVDCTGHGIPGALMSMLGASFLNQIVKEQNHINPAQILQLLDAKLVKILQQAGGDSVLDGMEAGIVSIDIDGEQWTYAGANISLFHIDNSRNLHEITATKRALGGKSLSKKSDSFKTHTFELIRGELIYLFSDGFKDQFGAEEPESSVRRYSKSRFQKLLLQNADKEMSVQCKKLREEFEIWKGSRPQLDDVLVVGIRF
jgi:tetratricopeptide (TPR) repeat protein/serine phosphatase RsbU (regulator of sigma subunit)